MTWCSTWQFLGSSQLLTEVRTILSKQLPNLGKSCRKHQRLWLVMEITRTILTAIKATQTQKTCGLKKKNSWEKSWKRTPSVNWKVELHNKTEPREQANRHLNLWTTTIKTVILIQMISKLIRTRSIHEVEEMSQMLGRCSSLQLR